MCRHDELVFLGFQKTLHKDKLALYNCLDCGTTISLKKKSRFRTHNPPKRIKLAFE
ncbi:hypothetical protein ACFL4T_13550 [candidate division KSB1 bacterium]